MSVVAGAPRRLGVPAPEARLRFEEGPEGAGEWAGRRLLVLDGKPAFERSFWCGTCGFLFRRLEGATGTLSPWDAADRLADRLADPDEAGNGTLDETVLQVFGSLLPEGDYLPLRFPVEPTLVVPGQEGDYFTGEQVTTWGVNAFWGLPESPRTPYYRTFETAVGDAAHLYEFVVPMVPPSWNDQARVAEYARQGERGRAVVAVSTLDRCLPATDTEATDYHEHWCLTHFLLDGHHRTQAAASTGRALPLLSLLALDACLAEPRDHQRLPALRARPRQVRAAGPTERAAR